MSFKTSYKTVDYQTNLPYNCICHVSRKDEVLSEEIIKGQRPTVKMLSRWSSQEKFGNKKGQARGFSA